MYNNHDKFITNVSNKKSNNFLKLTIFNVKT